MHCRIRPLKWSLDRLVLFIHLEIPSVLNYFLKELKGYISLCTKSVSFSPSRFGTSIKLK